MLAMGMTIGGNGNIDDWGNGNENEVLDWEWEWNGNDSRECEGMRTAIVILAHLLSRRAGDIVAVMTKCVGHTFHCDNKYECANISALCNLYYDCSDGSDEQHCRSYCSTVIFAEVAFIVSTTDLYYYPDAVLPVHIVSSDEATAKSTS